MKNKPRLLQGMTRLIHSVKSPSPHALPYNGHVATIAPWLAMNLRPPMPQRTSPFHTTVEDKRWGQVHLYGFLDDVPQSRRLAVIVHGLGGCADSLYGRALAVEAQRRGMAALRLSCRGAARQGEDLHHAGLFEDILGAINAPQLLMLSGIGPAARTAVPRDLRAHAAYGLAATPGTPRSRISP